MKKIWLLNISRLAPHGQAVRLAWLADHIGRRDRCQTPSDAPLGHGP